MRFEQQTTDSIVGHSNLAALWLGKQLGNGTAVFVIIRFRSGSKLVDVMHHNQEQVK